MSFFLFFLISSFVFYMISTLLDIFHFLKDQIILDGKQTKTTSCTKHFTFIHNIFLWYHVIDKFTKEQNLTFFPEYETLKI